MKKLIFLVSILGMLLTACSIDNSISDDAAREPINIVDKKLSLEEFKSLKKGISRVDILLKLGNPDKNISSEGYLYEYKINDTSTAVLGFTYDDKLSSVKLIYDNKDEYLFGY